MPCRITTRFFVAMLVRMTAREIVSGGKLAMEFAVYFCPYFVWHQPKDWPHKIESQPYKEEQI